MKEALHLTLSYEMADKFKPKIEEELRLLTERENELKEQLKEIVAQSNEIKILLAKLSGTAKVVSHLPEETAAKKINGKKSNETTKRKSPKLTGIRNVSGEPQRLGLTEAIAKILEHAKAPLNSKEIVDRIKNDFQVKTEKQIKSLHSSVSAILAMYLKKPTGNGTSFERIMNDDGKYYYSVKFNRGL